MRGGWRGRSRWWRGAGVLLALVTLAVTSVYRPVGAAQLGPDGASGTRLPGKFVWFELVTDDLAAASRFYEAVFGWRFRAVAGAPASYHLIENEAGARVAGTFVHTPRQAGARSARWLTLISVTDVPAAARYATGNGGSVVAAPTRLGDRGVHALLRDAEGAMFGVLSSDRGDPADTPVADGDFFWVDLFAREPERAAQFYAGLAGYEISARETSLGGSRLVLQSQGYARGGVVPMPTGLEQPGWLPYVLVDDVAGILEKATAAGAKVLVKPRPGLLDGNLAVIADPQGGVVGIVNWTLDAGESNGGSR